MTTGGQPPAMILELPFVHCIRWPDDPDGSVLFLLHGSGRDENDLLPMAAEAAPRAVLVGIRGRSVAEGIPRWYRRLTPSTFDQDDIRAEAAALAAFAGDAVAGYGFDPAQITWVGYSNGANMIAALMALCPGLVRRAVLMRAMAALDDLPATDLTGVRVLMLTGRRDPYGAFAPRLDEWLRASGADLTHRQLKTHHGLGAGDVDAMRDWL